MGHSRRIFTPTNIADFFLNLFPKNPQKLRQNGR